MKLKNFTLIVLSTLVIFALTSFAQVKKEIRIFKDKDMPEIEVFDDEDIVIPPRDRIIEKLDLSDTQKKEFKKLRSELQKKQIDLRAKIRTSQIELSELFESDKIDRAAIEKKLRDISDLKLKMKLNWLDHWFAVYKLLDEKQQKIWKEHFQMKEPPLMHKFQDFGRGFKFRDRCRFW